jgi:serine protease inhibitor
MRVSRLGIASFTAFTAGCLALATGCGGSAGTTPSPAGPSGSEVVQSNLSRDTSPNVSSADVDEVASGNTDFAFDLYQQIAPESAQNLFYSPYSISLALAMTYAGARGDTATQMASTLHFSLPPATLHPAFDKLDLELRSRADGGKGLTLNIADSLWGDQAIQFEHPFLDTLAVSYGAGLHVVDFQHATEAARGAINGWVSDETHDKIPNLIGEGALTPDTRLVLVNAIYFKASWQTQFDPTLTAPKAFTRLDGSTVQANEMSEATDLGYAEGSNYQAVEIPYQGGKTSMVVVLPAPGQFTAVEDQLAGSFVRSLFNALSYNQVDLDLPKFTVHGETIDLKKELKALGMTDAFDGSADFSGMVDPSIAQIYLAHVLHQAFVKVDETGTEAAAATAVIGNTGSAAPVNVKTVNVDRPFLFMIRDVPTNSVLFAGRVLDPTATPSH